MLLKSTVQKNIEEILERKNLTIYEISKKIKEKDSTLYGMVRGRTKFSDKFTKKLLPILEVSREEFNSWVLADKYSKNVLELAIKGKKEFPYKRKSLFKAKIDALLEEKDMSRTMLAARIKVSQSSLNSVIIGKYSLSAKLLQKLSEFFEIPEDEILSWKVADKYSLEMLEMALERS